ncbi:MAG: dihydroxyacetone kinase subunit L [Tannerellaceae bacterium]|nr:dihydroxyacetone kinase subunit L [Tannerellaceae bacterium]
MEEFTSESALKWCDNLAEIYQQKKDELTELDRQIGDADHGLNMARGFTTVAGKVNGMANQDIGTIFRTVAMTLISTVGGASGPLYGSFFLQMAGKAIGKKSLTTNELSDLLQAGLQGVIMRGKAVVGDKTMIDALSPAVRAMEENKEKGLQEALNEAAKSARQGAESTIPVIAKKGRASYLGERSKGHEDPGAESTALLFEQLAKSVVI